MMMSQTERRALLLLVFGRDGRRSHAATALTLHSNLARIRAPIAPRSFFYTSNTNFKASPLCHY